MYIIASEFIKRDMLRDAKAVYAAIKSLNSVVFSMFGKELGSSWGVSTPVLGNQHWSFSNFPNLS